MRRSGRLTYLCTLRRPDHHNLRHPVTAYHFAPVITYQQGRMSKSKDGTKKNSILTAEEEARKGKASNQRSCMSWTDNVLAEQGGVVKRKKYALRVHGWAPDFFGRVFWRRRYAIDAVGFRVPDKFEFFRDFGNDRRAGVLFQYDQ